MRGALNHRGTAVFSGLSCLIVSVMLCVFAIAAFAGEAQYVVGCDSSRSFWRCELVADGDAHLPSHFDASNALVPQIVDVPANGAASVDEFGAMRFKAAEVTIAKFADVPATLKTRARYFGPGNSMSLYLPALHDSQAINDKTTDLRAGFVSNYDKKDPAGNVVERRRTNLLLFNIGDVDGDVLVSVRDENDLPIPPYNYEAVSVPPVYFDITTRTYIGGYIFYPLKAAVAHGSVRIRNGGTIGPESISTILGYAVIGDDSGATAPDVEPFNLVLRLPAFVPAK